MKEGEIMKKEYKDIIKALVIAFLICLGVVTYGSVKVNKSYNPVVSSEATARKTVTEYLDTIIRCGHTNDMDYLLGDYLSHPAKNENYTKVAGFIIKGYQVKNASAETISVDVTFNSMADTDIHRTLIFCMDSNSKIEDIR